MHKYPSFVWKGHEKLNLKTEQTVQSGYYLDAMLNIFPYSPIFSLEYCLKWGLFAFFNI